MNLELILTILMGIGLTAASAVGDDNIQKQSQGYVVLNHLLTEPPNKGRSGFIKDLQLVI